MPVISEVRSTFNSILLAFWRDCFVPLRQQPHPLLAKSPFAPPTAHNHSFFLGVCGWKPCLDLFVLDGIPFLQEASSALPEVLPTDVASSLVHLWRAAMAGTQLSAFCDILEQQVALFDAINVYLPRVDFSVALFSAQFTFRWDRYADPLQRVGVSPLISSRAAKVGM